MIRMTSTLLFISLLVAPAYGLAATATDVSTPGTQTRVSEVDIDLSTGNSLTVFTNNLEGVPLIIWVPSEHGLREEIFDLVELMSAQKLAIWLPDFHGSYMLTHSSKSLLSIDPLEISELIDRAMAQGYERIMVASAGRGAQLALHAARHWQQQHPGDRRLIGMSFIHPHLIEGRPEPGFPADYVPIAHNSNLPIYLIQPEYSTKFARSQEIQNVLSKGGSPVFVHLLKGVSGGFHARSRASLTPTDIREKAQLPKLWSRAMRMLAFSEPAPVPAQLRMPVASAPQALTRAERKQLGFREAKLHPYSGDPTPPALRLTDISGGIIDLAEHRDKVVLVNFWATWCGPCVEEIPSLSRLIDRMQDQPFKVITVNIGEPEATIREFVKQIPVNFPILMDKKGDAVRDWHVYAYPSNFLVDQQGRIRYAYRGALAWDAPEIVKTIEDTIAENQPAHPAANAGQTH